MNSVVCAFIWQEAVASNTVRISSPGFTISNLKWHYLFRQDFLAANLASFFASSVVKRKDGDMLDGAQSMACVPWQRPGSAELGGAVGKSQATHLGQGNWSFRSCCTLPSWLHSLKVPFGQYWIPSLSSDKAAAALPPPCKCSPSATLAFKYNMIISVR